MSDKMLSLAEASSLLNVSEVTVKRWAREHLLKSVKEGSDLLFPEPDVLKYKEMNDKFRK
ncbi:MAG: DNA-binding protein [Bermanella sp.]|jgi:excisionase family DNA binding protein|nr:DNA-binding protein [Bermanella sp.]|tara:strand:- start:3202 stop:3381 length:180 start_codon:yes stop_codon:yes gene_type:complete